MFKGFIYQIKNKINQKSYIGQTTRDINQRWKEHVDSAKKHTHLPLCNSINKYGLENFEFIVLNEIQNDDKKKLLEELNELERFLIHENQTLIIQHGYNTMDGGKNQLIPPSVRNAISKSVKNFQKHNLVVLDAFRYSMLGKKHSLKSRKQMSKSRSGSRNGNFGKLGEKNHLFGKTRSPQFGQKISDTKQRLGQGLPIECKVAQLKAIRKPIDCFTLNGVFIKRYEFIGEVEKDGFSGQSVSRRIRNPDMKPYKNLLWKLVQKEST